MMTEADASSTHGPLPISSQRRLGNLSNAEASESDSEETTCLRSGKRRGWPTLIAHQHWPRSSAE